MENNLPQEQYAVAGLRRKRDQIVSEIADAEAKLQLLTMSLGHVEATLRLLAPDILLEALPKRPMKPRAKKGENSRPILAALHHATKPMPTKELARALLQAHGKPALRVHREAYEAARNVLRDLRKRGAVRMVGKAEWELVRDDA